VDVEELIAADPKLHQSWDESPQRSLKVMDEVLRYIDHNVVDGSRTLETGCGVSTLLFALRRAQHLCVSPDGYAIESIREFCAANRIPLDRVRFEVAPSESVLPRCELETLDLVLVDGSHSFPAVFIDWYYTAPALKVGGRLVIDDTQLWTGRVLKDFLLAEPEWTLDRDFAPRSVAFVKAREVDPQKGWWAQQYVVAMSSPPSSWGLKLRRGAELIRQGRVRALAQRIAGTVSRR